MTIHRVGLLSCARIAGVIYAALGLLTGAVFTVVALLEMAVLGTQISFPNSTSSLTGGLMAIGAVLVLPIFYGLVGFVFTLIGAWIYNVAASKVGGIEIDVA